MKSKGRFTNTLLITLKDDELIRKLPPVKVGGKITGFNQGKSLTARIRLNLEVEYLAFN